MHRMAKALRGSRVLGGFLVGGIGIVAVNTANTRLGVSTRDSGQPSWNARIFEEPSGKLQRPRTV